MQPLHKQKIMQPLHTQKSCNLSSKTKNHATSQQKELCTSQQTKKNATCLEKKLRESQNAALRTSHWLSNVKNCRFQKYQFFFTVATAVTVWTVVRIITQPLHTKKSNLQKFNFYLKKNKLFQYF